MNNIKEDLLRESELVLLSFATGIQDAASCVDYGCFASNQTGNMLFLALVYAAAAIGSPKESTACYLLRAIMAPLLSRMAESVWKASSNMNGYEPFYILGPQHQFAVLLLRRELKIPHDMLSQKRSLNFPSLSRKSMPG